MSGTPWSLLAPDAFLRDDNWGYGQGRDAPDRLLLRHLLEHSDLSKLTTFLEAGCGTGIEVEGLRDAGILDRLDYLGIDITPEFVDYCRNRYPDANFEVGDMLDAESFLAGSMEAAVDKPAIVYARAVLEHIGDDGEEAFRTLCRAAKNTVIVSWFIRPTWVETEVGVTEIGEFVHHTYGARALIRIARDHGDLYRYDFDHHSTKASVWIIAKDRQRGHNVSRAAHRFVASDEFLDALLPVPPDPQEELNDLRDVLAETVEGFDAVIASAERVPDLLDVLDQCADTLLQAADLYDGEDNEIPLRPVRERALGVLDSSVTDPTEQAVVAVRTARDARARAEEALKCQ